MARWMGLPAVAALALSACVTINVYFPAAEARDAAREFVENVIGDPVPADAAAPTTVPGGGMARSAPRFDPWLLLGIGSAQAQTPDLSIRTPAIQAIQARMEQRFNGTLRAHFDSGALGFDGNGTIVVRDASQVPINQRVAVNSAVADDNRDRQAVYREIAVANGHPEWESQIREVFARQWVASARAGWWYRQDGRWTQK